MASVGLPPPPINDAPGSFTWLEWYRQLRSYVSTSGSVPWYIINFAGSNITDIATREHNSLQGLQGGTSGEMYHLTSAQQAWVAAGNTSHGGGWQAGKNRAILDEGVSIATDFTSMNFVGAGVTATAAGTAITVTIPDGTHNNLSGLQGGTSSEYYHLTANETRNARNTIEYVTPSTGFSQTIANTTTFLVIEPSGTLATGTVTMPASPVDGQLVRILTTQTITALTHSPNTGQTLKGALTTLVINTGASWLYKTSTTTWYKVS